MAGEELPDSAEIECERLSELLDKAAADLGEHFEAVQIHVSSCDRNGTMTLHRGCGNWNARQGMAQAFIKRSESQDAATFIADELAEREE